MPITLNGDTGITTPTYGGADTSEYLVPVTGFKNRIINGAMQIAQRGTSATGITVSGYYTIDRWRQGLGSAGTWTQTQDTDVPSGQGFSNSLKLTCTTAKSSLGATDLAVFGQLIEAFNLQDLNYGTANAENVTLSFWIKSNKTGTYIVELFKSSASISQAFTISAANTWEKKSLTFIGDTVNAIPNTNGLGFTVQIWVAAGTTYTSGTLQTAWGNTTSNRAVGQVNLADTVSNYINLTGVQLEKGSTATSFDYRPYGTELALCQRYYYKFTDVASNTRLGQGLSISTTTTRTLVQFPTLMRTAPTSVETSGTASDYRVRHSADTATTCSAVPTFDTAFTINATVAATVASGLTSGGYHQLTSTSSNGFLAWSAEL
jgi:hypothetical protein